eukprot:GHVP01032541.1.p1 GENE.GHVP01032541.1~~GHVP01032541.1.p1  ORF type:complete len:150 (-),score=27.70 GHVP01032541.1:328-777(-)
MKVNCTKRNIYLESAFLLLKNSEFDVAASFYELDFPSSLIQEFDTKNYILSKGWWEEKGRANTMLDTLANREYFIWALKQGMTFEYPANKMTLSLELLPSLSGPTPSKHEIQIAPDTNPEMIRIGLYKRKVVNKKISDFSSPLGGYKEL